MTGALAIAGAVTGNIGFITGMLSMVVGTFEKTAGVIDTARSCQTRLQVFRFRLLVCEKKMQEWQNHWGDYEMDLLFGVAGARDIETLLQDIKAAQKCVSTALNSSDSFEGNQDSADQWQSILSTQGCARPLPQNAPALHPEPGFWQRVAMALWKNTSLETDIKGLDHQIDALIYLSKNLYDNNQLPSDGRGLSQRSQVERAFERQRKRDTRMRRLCRMIDHAYNVLDLDKRWALLLSPLNMDDQSFLATHPTFLVKFVQSAEVEPVNDTIAIQFHTNYNLDTDQDNVSPTRDLEPTISLSNTIERDLQFGACLHGDEYLQKSFETLVAVQWASIAQQVATWGTLLLNCNWMNHLCTCGVRSALVGGTERVATFSRLHPDAVSTPCQRSCAPSGASLGIALAEIILVKPLHDENMTGEVGTVGACENTNRATRTRLSYKEILEEVKKKNHSCWLAVRHCLTVNGNPTISHYCSAQEVDDFVKNVIRPLKRYTRALEQHHQAHRDDLYETLGSQESIQEYAIPR